VAPLTLGTALAPVLRVLMLRLKEAVVGEAPHLYEVNIQWTSVAKYLATACKSYSPQSPAQRIYLSRQRKPATITPAKVGEGVALAWACDGSGHPVNDALRTEEYQSNPLEKMSSGYYEWDVGGKPMVLLTFPPSAVLLDAQPEPADVWQSDGRVCAFWQAPSEERKIAFKIGTDASPDRNIQYWQKRLDSHAKWYGAHPTLLALALILLIVVASIVLGIVFNQATAAAWIGTGGTALGLVWSLTAPLLKSRRRRPFRSHSSTPEPAVASGS
jgi:hypothetical protein